ncbi:MAG: hypothetical protein HMLIMOIP_001867 [Candidatus Nitrosomirales archaeon]|jgi:hypothetical protein
MHGYRDPDTGLFVGIGEFWNDHPFWYPLSNITLQFQFLDDNQNLLYEKEQSITHTLSINSGFIIPPLTTLPFSVVLDDYELSKKAKYFREDGTIHMDRSLKWKPADLIVSFNNIEMVKSSPDLGYKKWAVHGTILNNYTRSTQHVYVIAGIYQGYNLTGVAGYSPNDKQPLELNGFERKNFTLYATLPYELQPDRVYLYAESEDSSMKYPYSFPINGEHKIRGTSITSPHISVGAKITFSSNMTNISRHDHDFYWILQIKKLPQEDNIELPAIVHRGVTEHIEVIPASLAALDSIRIEFPWSPSSRGLYAYQIYVWDDLETPAPLALLSVTSFHDDHLIRVS